jgi:transposase-like protein/5-methylcytosine-specific restriction endonuclease McrA
MRSLLEAGVSVAEVSRRTGIPYNVVRHHREGVSDGDAAADPPDTPDASTRDEIRRLLDEGCSRADVARRLDISRSTVSYHAKRFGMEMDQRASRRYDWTVVQAYYDAGHTVRQCQEHFGFSSASWTSAVRRGDAVARPTAMPIEELLRGPRHRRHVKIRLIKAGLLLAMCAECGITTWRDRALALELHHVNGDGKDNRLENLALLCPNCHSQTDSWGGRNAGRAKAPRAARRARSTR